MTATTTPPAAPPERQPGFNIWRVLITAIIVLIVERDVALLADLYAVGAIESGKGGGNPLMGGSTIGSTSMPNRNARNEATPA